MIHRQEQMRQVRTAGGVCVFVIMTEKMSPDSSVPHTRGEVWLRRWKFRSLC